MKTYIIAFTKEHVRVIKTACGNYINTRSGLFFDLAQDIAFAGKEPDDCDDLEFFERCSRRNASEHLFEGAYGITKKSRNSKKIETQNIKDVADLLSAIIQDDWESTCRAMVSESRLAAIQIACEDYLRTRMGQFYELPSDIAFAGERGDVDGMTFDERIRRRNIAQRMMEDAFRVSQPENQRKTEDMLIAEDIWGVVKHQRWVDRPKKNHNDWWSVDSHVPLNLAKEPMITIKTISDSED